MDEAYKRAAERLEERNQLWADLARALGYTDQRVSNWRARGIPRHELAKVANFLGVTTDWLLTGKGNKSDVFQRVNEIQAKKIRKPEDSHLTDDQVIEKVEQERWEFDPSAEDRMLRENESMTNHSVWPGRDELEFAGHLDAWDGQTPLGPEEVEIPLFREVELAAGTGATQVVENHGAKLRFAKSTLAMAGVPAEAAACAFVRGDSMEPRLPDGTCIGVNTADTAVRDGQIYAMDHEGMLRVKHLYRIPGGGLKVVSSNEKEHPPEEYSAEEVYNSIRVIGRVFWFSGLL